MISFISSPSVKTQNALCAKLNKTSLSDTAIVWGDTFTRHGSRMDGIRSFSGYNKGFNEQILRIRDAHPDLFYIWLNMENKVRNIGILDDIKYAERGKIFDTVIEYPDTDKQKEIVMYTKEHILDELFWAYNEYELIILVHEHSNKSIDFEIYGEIADNNIDTNTIINMVSSPIMRDDIEQAVADFFKNNVFGVVKNISLFYGVETNEDSIFLNIKKIYAKSNDIIETRYPLLILRTSFSGGYNYCVYSTIEKNIIEAHYPESTETKKIILQMHEKVRYTGIPIFLNKEEPKILEGKHKNINFSDCELYIKYANKIIKEKFMDTLSVKILIQGYSTLAFSCDNAHGWTAKQWVGSTKHFDEPNFFVLQLNTKYLCEAQVKETVCHELAHIVEFHCFDNHRDITHDKIFDSILDKIRNGSGINFEVFCKNTALIHNGGKVAIDKPNAQNLSKKNDKMPYQIPKREK